MKKIIRQAAAISLCAVLAGTLLTGCGAKGVDLSRGQVRLGSKTDTANRIVAEVYALALTDSGYKVTRNYGLTEEELSTRLTGKDLNLYPEYLSTGLRDVLKYDPIDDPDKAEKKLQEGMEVMRDATALDRSEADCAPGFAITKKAAEKYHITNTSDLQKHASSLRFLKTPEADSSDFDYAGAEKKYGKFSWKSTTESKNDRSKYKSLLNDKADVCCARATDGWLTDENLVFLDDDRSFWPAYNISAVVHNNLLTHRTLLGAVLISIDKGLTTEGLRKLCARVDIDGESCADVAKDYYEKIQDDLPKQK